MMILLLPSFAMALPQEVESLTKNTYQQLKKLKTYEEKWSVISQYKAELDSIQKTFKSVVDLVEYEGLKLTLMEFDKNQLMRKNCSSIRSNLKAKFYPRGLASKDGPTHYKYALKLLQPFCK
tara:strand:- start:2511 stop:2876 length:366 start_codon:yes stop_codon:yes gene_type:complete